MKTFVTIITAAGLFTLSNLALADQCPGTLNAEQMYDCIVAEAADGSYAGEDQTVQYEATEAESTEKHSQYQAQTSQQDPTI